MYPSLKTCAIVALTALLVRPASAQCTFNFTPGNPCPGESVTFTVASPMQSSTYKWDLDGDGMFGDGIGPGTTVTYTYPYSATQANFIVKLQKDGTTCATQTVAVKAGQQPAIGVVSGGTLNGSVIHTCNGGQPVTLKVYNNTLLGNPAGTVYTIAWTSGGTPETLPANSNQSIEHLYPNLSGYAIITLTATLPNGCVLKKNYQYFNGSNPNIGLSSIGNTNGLCAPTTLTFNVQTYQDNPLGTTYQFYKNDQPVGPLYTQGNLLTPFVFTHTFDATSCGETTPDGQYENAFSIKIVAKNPCGEKTASVQPITLSTKPVPDFIIQGPPNYCPDEIFTFVNSSTDINEFNTQNNQCADTLNANWEISPGTLGNDWTFVAGGFFNYNQIKVKFLKPGLYTIKMTLNPEPDCGPVVISKTVTILEPPTAAVTPEYSNPNGCLPLTVKFKNQSKGYQVSYNWQISPGTGWQWQTGSSATDREPTAVFTSPGDYSVTLTVSNVCSTATWTTTIMVKDKPTATLPMLGPFCQTATLNLSASNAPNYTSGNGTISGYSWAFPGGTPASSTAQNPVGIQYGPVSVPTNFTYTVSVTNECGTATASKTLEVQVPAVISLPPDMTVCINAPAFQITPVSPINGTWSGSPGVSASGLFTPSNAGGPGIKTLTYTYGATGSPCTATKTMKITVVDLPSVNAGADLSRCVNDPVFPLAGTPTTPTGAWTVNPTTAALSGSSFNPMVAGPGNFTLTYNYTDGNGCKNSDQTVLTVNALPVITANDAVFCNTPGLVALPTATPAGGTWSGTGVTGSQFNPQTLGGPTFTVTYAYTDPATMCANSKNVTITVTDSPSINAGADKVFCINDTPFNLDSDATPASGGVWSGPGVSGNTFTPLAAGPGTHTLTLKTGSGNCEVNDTRKMTVNPLPIVAVPETAKSCINETAVTLTSTPATGGTWVSTAPGQVTGNAFNPQASGSGSFTLTYNYTDANGCKNSDQTTMTVNSLPVITANDAAFCNTPGLVALPTATPPGGTWSGTGVTGSQFNPQTPGGPAFTVTYAYTDPATTCSNSKSVTITVSDPDNVEAGLNKTFCLNDAPFNLNSDATPSSGGIWSGPGVSGNTFTPSVAGPGTHSVSLKTGTGNCEVTDTRTMLVHPLPTVAAGPDIKTCVSETKITLSPSPTMGTWTSSGTGQVSNNNTFAPNTSGVGTFTLTFSFTDANACTNTDVLTVTVNPLPTVVAGDTLYCNAPGTVALPFASPGGGNWSGPGVSNGMFNPASAGGVGGYQAVYTYEDTNKCVNRDTSNITVIAPDNVDAGVNKTFCLNDAPFNLNSDATPASGGIWSGPGVSGNIFDPMAAGTGTHTINLKTGAGNCEVNDTRTMTVNPLPTVDVPPATQSCVSETAVVLTSTPVIGGTWTATAPGQVSGNVFNPKISGVGTFTLTFAFTDANTCINTDQMTLTVNPLPTVIAHDTVLCNTPGAVSLPFSSPSGGIWSGPGILNNMFNPQSAGGVGSYPAVYTYEDTNKCVNRDTSNIAVIAPDNVDAGANKTFCLNDAPFNLNSDATPASGGIWSGPGVSGNIFDPMAAGAGTHAISLKIGTGNCEVNDTRTMTVNPLPVVTAGLDAKTCVSETALTLLPNPTTGGVWTATGTGQIAGNVFNPKASGVGDFTLIFSFTDANTCTNTDEMTITVNPLPTVFASDTLFCDTPGAVALPFASPSGGIWSGPGISNGMFEPQDAGGVGIYPAVYTFEDANKCVNRDTANIKVEAPVAVNAGRDTSFCVNDLPFNLNTNGTFPATNGRWSGPGVLDSVFDPKQAGVGLHALTYKYGIGNCEVEDTRTIRVNPLPSVEAGANDAACVSETAVALAPNPAGGAWLVGNAVLSGNNFLPDSSGTGSFLLTWVFTDTLGCRNSDSLVFTVHPLPIPTSRDTSFCNTPGLVILPVANPTGGGWSGPGVSGFNFDPQGAGGVGQYPATYHFTDSNGCTDSTAVTIEVTEPIPAVAGPGDTLCIGDGLLQLPGFSPATGGKWTGTGIVNISTGLFDPVVAGGGWHPLVYSFGIGNCELHDTTSVLVIAVAIEAGPDRTVCFADPSFTLTNFNPATGGTWAGAGITSAAGNFDPGAAGVGSHVLRYEFVDPILGCKFFDSLTIEVNPMPESDFPQPTSACINEEIPFENNSKSKFKVLWDFGDGQISMDSVPTHTYTDTGTYTIKLTTTNEFGCTDMMSRTIFVTEPPFAFFTPMPDTGCAVLPVVVQNGSYGWQTSYVWSYGNLHTDSTYAPPPMLLPGGTKDTFYVITLTATNLCATRVWTDSVLVHPLPITRFGTATDTICTGQTIEFSNNVLGQPEAYFWDFGNGQTSTDSLPGPVQYFTDTVFRTYTVRLVATNFCGSDTFEHDITVKPVEVRAFFNVPNLVGCQPYTVQFTNFATPGAAVTWQFGDGGSSFDANPTHTFAQPGTYKVVQKASDGCGYDSTFALIEVLPAPRVSFECKPQICRGDTLFFTNTSPDPLAAVRWDFGDGDTSNFYNPFHIFGSAGTKTVTLTGIFAQNGCPAPFSQTVTVLELPTVNFAPDRPDGCVPLTVNFQNQSQGATYFEWDFGDGNTQPGIAPTHTFEQAGQFEIKLVGVDLSGCREDTLLRYITVHPIPSPAFEMRRDRLCGLPVVVDFVNQTPDAVGYTWTFGDGTGASPQNNPQHSYPQPGDFEVRLIAENTFGCRDTTAQVFGAYGQPEVGFDWSPDEGCAPLTVFFENLSTFTTRASWAFSDGGTSDSLAGTAHTFYEWGKHGATLIVSHRDVCFDTLALPDIIEVFPSPTANFIFAETVTDPPSGMFTFTDLSSGAVRWLWEFGGGDSSTLPSPAHRYFSNGPKLVRLTVWGENGCPDDTVRSVTPMQMRGLFIPDAFTPALANGLAAIFQPAGVGLREFEIAVYSSFGQLLWRSGTEDLVRGQPGPGWDGTFKGELLPQDVYTWQVKKAIFEDGTSWGGKRVGSVTLIR